MKPEIVITQVDNGWVLKFVGHDSLPKIKVCLRWEEVLKELDDYFGWYDCVKDRRVKVPTGI